jgi:hypothetical protein
MIQVIVLFRNSPNTQKPKNRPKISENLHRLADKYRFEQLSASK